MPPQDPQQARWFMEQLQPHESMLRGWLHGQFPPGLDIDDIVQEAFVRVLEANQNGGVQSPKTFLFATARNLAGMRRRHQMVAREKSLTETDVSGILDEDADVPHAVARTEELELMTRAIHSLPTRCRQVVTLRKIYGMSQKEVAAKLGISEHTVEAQIAIGVRKITKFFKSIEPR